MPEAAENQGTTRKPMDRAAAARHAALVRWKKEQPFGQPNQDRIANRVRELLAKKKKAKGGTGGKAKLTPEQRAQQKQTEIDNNRSAVYDKTGLSDAGIDAINALESGDQPTNADDLITQGLAERDRAGNVRMTAAGHAFVRAADKGDPMAAREALSRGGDKLAQSADKERAKAQAAGKQLSEDVRRETAKREKEKAQIAKGKAGGGGKKESKERVNTAGTLDKERTEGESDSDESPSQQKQADNRAKVASEMADSDTGLSPSGSAALTAFADGANLPKDTAKQLADMGLLEQDSAGGHRLSYAGRATINAMNRGDTRAALDAISRAGDRAKAQADRAARESEREKAKAQATTEREKTKTQREKEKAERTAKEDASRARVEQARIEAAKKRNRKALDMDEDTDLEIKAGARHSRMDASHLDEAARHLHAAGATCPDCAPDGDSEEEDMDAEKALKGIQDNPQWYAQHECQDIAGATSALATLAILIQSELSEQDEDDAHIALLCDAARILVRFVGGELDELQGAAGRVAELPNSASIQSMKAADDDFFAVKSIGDGDDVRGPAVRFGSADEPDLSETRDYFTPSTDYWLKSWDKRPMLWHHTMPQVQILQQMKSAGAGPDEMKAMRDAIVYLEDNPVIGVWTKATVDPIAVWMSGQLDTAHRYRAAIKRMIDLGMLKISTDSALHLVRREKQPNGTHEVKRWPIIAASLTPSAAEPRLFDVQALKSWYGVAGIDLPFGIDDGAEPTKVADDERTRRITLELELLELDAA